MMRLPSLARPDVPVLSAFGVLAALLAGAVAAGCSSVDPEATSTVDCPPADRATFETVSAVIERRCGTIDCHGAPARPLRIYSQYGLRRPEPEDSPNIPPGRYPDYYSGAGALQTTDAELIDNALAVCGLEPEKTHAVFNGKIEPEELTFNRKARLTEKHKGGLIWNKGDAGDQCVIAWLTNKPNPLPCNQDLSHP